MISVNTQYIIIFIILIAVIVWIIYTLIRRKKSGLSGCDGCGSASNCKIRELYHTQKERKKNCPNPRTKGCDTP